MYRTTTENGLKHNNVNKNNQIRDKDTDSLESEKLAA